MSFTFLHTADWQLGASFGKKPDTIAPLLVTARLSVIDRIAAVAHTTGARHVLVAGDVFDAITVPPLLAGQTLARLGAYPQLIWHLMPGNHDPAQPGSIWHTLAAQSKSPNIRLHLTPEPVLIEPGVLLLPAPLHAKAMSTDPTAYMDAVQSPPGTLRIGMAHGSAARFGTAGDAQVPIDPARASHAKLDYLALGDWHGLTKINERTWYSGTPEPDRGKDNEPGYTLAVTISSAGAMPVVDKHRTAAFLWLDRTMAVRAATDLEPLANELTTLGAPAQPVLLALTLTGRLPLTESAALSAQIAVIQAHVAHLDLDRTGLLPAIAEGDFQALFTGGLAPIAERLAARQNDAQTAGDAVTERIAGRALQMLAQWAGAPPS